MIFGNEGAEKRRGLLRRYGLAVAAVAAALAIRLVVRPYVGSAAPFVTFLAATTVAAWYGGIGPSFLAILLSLASVDYFLIPPLYTLGVESSGTTSLNLAFLVVAALVAKTTDSARLSRAQSEERYRQLTAEVGRRKQAEDLLRKSLSLARTMAWVWNVVDNSLTLFGAVGDIVGVTAIRTYSDFLAMVVPEDREWLAKRLSACVRENRKFDAEYRIVNGQGQLRWLAAIADVSAEEPPAPAQMAGVIFDITERKAIAQELRASETRFRELAEAMPHVVWTAAGSGEFEYYNHTWYELTGLPVGSISQIFDHQKVLHRDDFERWVAGWLTAVRDGRVHESEYRIWDVRDKRYRWYLGRAVPITNAEGAIVRWFGTSTDIQDQKETDSRLENEIQHRTSSLQDSLHALQSKEEQLRRSLQEKETLIKEVHHRVKNNLQVVSSLLRMQGNLVRDQEASEALKESQRRVLSMALIHERLYGGQHLDQIDFAEYAKTLIDELLRSYADRSDRIVSRVEVAQVLLNMDQAIPCGLMLNELVTNALKHAYPDGQKGEIIVGFEELENRRGKLTVADQGVGLPEGFNFRNSKSMGLPIVEILAKQVGGKVNIETHPGTTFTVEFPIENHATVTS